MQLIEKIKKLKNGDEKWSFAGDDKEIGKLLVSGFLKINKADFSFTEEGIKAIKKALNEQK